VLQRVEAEVVEPFAVLGDLRQCAPSVIGEAGNGDPVVLAFAPVGAVGRRRLVRRAVAVAAELASLADQSRIVAPVRKMPASHCEASIHCLDILQ
jgi:hypothetical protein